MGLVNLLEAVRQCPTVKAVVNVTTDKVYDNKEWLWGEHPHETRFLKLDCSKAKHELHWLPCWSLDTALDKIVEWSKVYQSQGDLRAISLAQITAYEFDLNQ